MTSTSPIPNDPAEITTQWLQAMLEVSGFSSGLAATEVTPIGTGQMATSVRADLTFDAPTDAPRSVVIKLASQNESSRAAGASGAYLKEIRFYESLISRVEVRTPAPIFSRIDESTGTFVLVLEDLAPARQGDQIDGCSVEHARLAAINIAGLHGPTWQDASLRRLAWLTTPPEQTAEAYAMAQEVMGVLTIGFIDRYASDLNEGHVELLRWFADNTERWLAAGQDRFALTHGDHRLDNLLFGTTEGGYPVAAVDWQTVGVRNPVADVAYLLGTGLEPDTRRAVEAELVAEYHRHLVSYGVEDYRADACFEDYCVQSFHALLITVMGSMMTGQTGRGDAMFMAMLHRSAAQIDDLDARSRFQ